MIVATRDRIAGQLLGPLNCPVCDYNLTGLPEAHRCPECGFAYDAATRVWTATTPRRFLGWIVVAVLILALATPVSFMLTAPEPARVRFVAIGVVVWTIVAGRAVILLRRRPFVAVRAEGVVLGALDRSPRLIRWEQIDRLEIRNLGRRPVPTLVLRHPPSRIEVAAILPDEWAARTFADAVTRAAAEPTRAEPRA